MNKNAFSLMEVIVSIVLLSVVMITLIQVKVENINIISKASKNDIVSDAIFLAINDDKVDKRNESFFFTDKFSLNDDLRKKFKDIKIDIKDEKIDSIDIETDEMNFIVDIYETKYSDSNEQKAKTIYSFKIN